MVKIILSILIFFNSLKVVLANDTTLTIVNFAFNKHHLTQKEQEKILANPCLNNRNIVSIEIYGHTDQIGLVDYNKKLSLKRAITVKNFLLEKGINTELITLIVGKGKLDLVTQKKDAESRYLNRRVEIKITCSSTIESKTKDEKDTKQNEDNKPKEETTLTQKINDTTVKAGDNLVLKNINFEGGRHTFLKESYRALEELYEAMHQIKTLEIDIQGHICCSVEDEDGLDLETQTRDLSLRRAKAVYDYLIKRGIAAERMSFKGMGRRFPLTAERDEMERSLNRRVEIKILKK